MNLRNVSIEVSNQCQMKCHGCYFLRQRKNKPMSNEQIKDSIRKIGRPERLVFIGGEPFMNKNLPELCYYAAKNSTPPDILTNGWYATEKNLSAIKRYINCLQVSLDYPFAELHDFRRGAVGAFNRATDCLQWCMLLGIPTTVAWTCGKYNFSYLKDMVKLSKRYGSELRIIRFIPYEKSDMMHSLDPTQNYQLHWLIDRLKLVNSSPLLSSIDNHDHRCDACINRMAIKADGRVSGCDFLSRTFGNILNEPLGEIMRKMKTWRIGNFGKTRKTCGKCRVFDKCWGGCMAFQEVGGHGKDMGCWL